MTIQFRCPDCELLEADESDVGQFVICPFCGRELEVPAPPEIDEAPRIHRRKHVSIDIDQANQVAAKRSPIGLDEPEIYHIRCPNGFVMEVPREMLGQQALCPCCQTEMALNLRDSIEFQKKRALEERIEETRLSKFWLHLAIVVTVLVVCGLGLIGLIEILTER